MTRLCLTIEFLNYWHAGSGKGEGHHVDALCERDHNGLPILPGRQLKGLLRNAVHRAEQWGWLKDVALPEGPLQNHEELLFGSRSHSESRDATQPGLLQIGNACLPSAEQVWLANAEHTELRAELFSELFSTAINENGTAKRYSLRGLEVCIPLTLQANIELNITGLQADLRQQQEAYQQAGTARLVLEASLPLLDNLGAYRSRGLGEAIVSLEASSKEC